MNLRRLTLHRFEVPCSHLHLAPVSMRLIEMNTFEIEIHGTVSKLLEVSKHYSYQMLLVLPIGGPPRVRSTVSSGQGGTVELLLWENKVISALKAKRQELEKADFERRLL